MGVIDSTTMSARLERLLREQNTTWRLTEISIAPTIGSNDCSGAVKENSSRPL
jgi:hypothetical protein